MWNLVSPIIEPRARLEARSTAGGPRSSWRAVFRRHLVHGFGGLRAQVELWADGDIDLPGALDDEQSPRPPQTEQCSQRVLVESLQSIDHPRGRNGRIGGAEPSPVALWLVTAPQVDDCLGLARLEGKDGDPLPADQLVLGHLVNQDGFAVVSRRP